MYKSTFFILSIVMLLSCEKTSNCVYHPILSKNICSVKDLERKSSNFHFEQYGGFFFSLDMSYFEDGRVCQDVNLFDEVGIDEVKDYKLEPIQSLVFSGDGYVSNTILDSLYGIIKMNKKKIRSYEYASLYSKKEKRIIGKLEYYSDRNRFIITLDYLSN